MWTPPEGGAGEETWESRDPWPRFNTNILELKKGKAFPVCVRWLLGFLARTRFLSETNLGLICDGFEEFKQAKYGSTGGEEPDSCQR